MSLPSFNIYPYKNHTDDDRMSPFTEDLQENILSSAYHVRDWLICLRYSDRIKMHLGWIYIKAIEPLYVRPKEVGVCVNAIARLLGNSIFIRDFKFAKTVITYIFDDGTCKAI